MTQPFLPPIERLQAQLADIWDTRWLTNDGPIHKRFEERLRAMLGVEHLALFANGTLAMEVAFRALELPPGGQVITSPFTFVATATSISNVGLEPVFVDIRADDVTLDPAAVEAAINERTVAIAPIHVYGLPCQLDAFELLADRHGLKLVYDAAHAFGVTVNDQCIGNYGHASMFSLHATKLFHAVECGLIVSPDPELIVRLNRLKNFGYSDHVTIEPGGTNAKLSELHAAVGLVNCDYFEQILQRRREQVELYQRLLRDVPGLSFPTSTIPNVRDNHSYMPILIDREVYGCDPVSLQAHLKKYNVFTRRYFFPLLTDTAAYAKAKVVGDLANARRLVDRVLCLPLGHDLPLDVVEQIAQLVAQCAT